MGDKGDKVAHVVDVACHEKCIRSYVTGYGGNWTTEHSSHELEGTERTMCKRSGTFLKIDRHSCTVV